MITLQRDSMLLIILSSCSIQREVELGSFTSWPIFPGMVRRPWLWWSMRKWKRRMRNRWIRKFPWRKWNSISKHPINAADPSGASFSASATIKRATICIDTEFTATLPSKRASNSAETAIINIQKDINSMVSTTPHSSWRWM